MRMDNNLYLSLSGQASSDVPNSRPVNTHNIQRATVAQIYKSNDKVSDPLCESSIVHVAILTPYSTLLLLILLDVVLSLSTIQVA